jgi:uncharacterized protein (TIGR00645 family)
MIKRWFETYLLLSRWLLAPLLVLLTFAQVALVVKAVKKAYGLIALFASDQEDHVALTVLNLVDITLTGALVVIVTLSVYENFVARVTPDDGRDWPSWMGSIDFSQLKTKLMSTIVAISAIKLLESFIDISETSDRDLYLYIGVHLTFVFGTLALALTEKFAGHGAKPRGAEPPSSEH